MNHLKNSLLATLLAGVAGLSLLAHASAATAPSVNVMRVPDGGIQPQALVDKTGRAHLLYYKGEPMHGDLYYVTWLPGKAPGSAIRVNKTAGSACAMGTIRGAQLALGANGRVHVVWNSSPVTAKTSNGHYPLFYTRLNDKGTAFEPERDLIAGTEMLDGGSTLAADVQGLVYVVWHAAEKGSDEAHGAVYLRISKDGGGKFSDEQRIGPQHGACGCCSMRAFAGKNDALYILYRTAVNNTGRDTELLVSRDHGKTFTSRTLSQLKATTCPMSTFAISEGSGGVEAAWENNGQVSLELLDAAKSPASPPGQGQRKYPVLAAANGNTMLSWTEGAGWGRGGVSAWQLFDAHGKPLGEHGQKEGVPAWSFTAVVPNGQSGFTIIY